MRLRKAAIDHTDIRGVDVVRRLRLNVKSRVRICGTGVVVPRVTRGLAEDKIGSVPGIYPIYKNRAGVSVRGRAGALCYAGPGYRTGRIGSFTLFTDESTVGVRNLSRTALRGFVFRNCIGSFASLFRLSGCESRVVAVSNFNRGSFLGLRDDVRGTEGAALTELICNLKVPKVKDTGTGIVYQTLKGSSRHILRTRRTRLIRVRNIKTIVTGDCMSCFGRRSRRRLFGRLLGRIRLRRRRMARSDRGFTKIGFIVAKDIRRFTGHTRMGTRVRGHNNGIAKDIASGAGCLVGGSMGSASSGGGGTESLKIPVVSRGSFLRVL